MTPEHGKPDDLWQVSAQIRVDPQIEVDQRARLESLRQERDNEAVAEALDRVRAAADGKDNILYPAKDALAKLATLGEVCDALRERWGAYQPSDRF